MCGALPDFRRRFRLSMYAGSSKHSRAKSLISRVALFGTPFGRPPPLRRLSLFTRHFSESGQPLDAHDEAAVAQAMNVVAQHFRELIRDDELERGFSLAIH